MVRSFEPNEPTIRKLAKFVKEEKCYVDALLTDILY